MKVNDSQRCLVSGCSEHFAVVVVGTCRLMMTMIMMMMMMMMALIMQCDGFFVESTWRIIHKSRNGRVAFCLN